MDDSKRRRLVPDLNDPSSGNDVEENVRNSECLNHRMVHADVAEPDYYNRAVDDLNHLSIFVRNSQHNLNWSDSYYPYEVMQSRHTFASHDSQGVGNAITDLASFQNDSVTAGLNNHATVSYRSYSPNIGGNFIHPSTAYRTQAGGDYLGFGAGGSSMFFSAERPSPSYHLMQTPWYNVAGPQNYSPTLSPADFTRGIVTNHPAGWSGSVQNCPHNMNNSHPLLPNFHWSPQVAVRVQSPSVQRDSSRNLATPRPSGNARTSQVQFAGAGMTSLAPHFCNVRESTPFPRVRPCFIRTSPGPPSKFQSPPYADIRDQPQSVLGGPIPSASAQNVQVHQVKDIPASSQTTPKKSRDMQGRSPTVQKNPHPTVGHGANSQNASSHYTMNSVAAASSPLSQHIPGTVVSGRPRVDWVPHLSGQSGHHPVACDELGGMEMGTPDTAAKQFLSKDIAHEAYRNPAYAQFDLKNGPNSSMLRSTKRICKDAPNFAACEDPATTAYLAKGFKEVDHITCPDCKIDDDADIVPLGTRCQLCNNDLAFAPHLSRSSKHAAIVPVVMPCGHCYHIDCLEEVGICTETCSDPPCPTCP